MLKTKDQPKLIRITTVPISLKLLLTGQMRYMRERGFEVLMISANGRERAEVVAAEQCPHRIVPMTRAITPWQDLKCLFALIQIFRKEKPDIVHSHTPKAGLLGMLAAKIAGVPVRLHTVAGMPLMTAAGSKRRLLMWMEKLTYRAAGKVLPNSRSLYDFILKNRLAAAEKLHLIGEGSSNGIDLERFSPEKISPEKLERIKNQIGCEVGQVWLLAVGRVVVDKGIGELLRAFLILEKEFPALRLLLLGPLEKERPEETLPADLIQTIQTHPGIVHISWSDEVEYFMHAADLLVHPSYREGFPNVLLQAGAMGCPIVCSNISGNSDIVEHEKTGLLFEVKNANDLAEKLRIALTKPDLTNIYAAALRRRIEDNFSRKAIHEKLHRYYLDLMKENA